MLENDYLLEIGKKINQLGFECSVISGGSYSYRPHLYQSLNEIRDLDLLIFFLDHEKISDFLTLHQQNLDEILHVSEPEIHFSREDLSPLTNKYVNGIRYSGLNELGQKISVKLLDYKYFSQAYLSFKEQSINILSKKDKRFYSKKTISGLSVDIGIINQKTPTGLCLLGDPDLIEIDTTYCLGVISDVLLSGQVIHEDKSANISTLKDYLIKKIISKTEIQNIPSDWTQIFVRGDRFPDTFKKEINQLFSNHQPNKTSVIQPQSEFIIKTVSPIIGGHYKQLNLSKKISSPIIEKRFLKSSGPFSSNSNYGLAIYKSGERAFFKEMLNELRFKGEIYGLITASAYFQKLRVPIHTDPTKNLISYDWFSGDMLARKRLFPPDRQTINLLMELELRRAEDHLNAYIRSASDLSNEPSLKEKIYFSRIHDIYFSRVIGNRLHEYYDKFILHLPNKNIDFSSLADLEIEINGNNYPSLNQKIQLAKDQLNPDQFINKELVCGLGDAHSGNVLCSNNIEDYTYIDYEFAGFHSPYLDIAKSLYNDCSYNLLYIDKIPPKIFSVSATVKENKLIINHNYQPDKLSRLIFQTKMMGTIMPYRQYCLNHHLPLDLDWQSTLGSAILCCGILTRNLSEFSENNFLINFANTIEFSDISHISSIMSKKNE